MRSLKLIVIMVAVSFSVTSSSAQQDSIVQAKNFFIPYVLIGTSYINPAGSIPTDNIDYKPALDLGLHYGRILSQRKKPVSLVSGLELVERKGSYRILAHNNIREKFLQLPLILNVNYPFSCNRCSRSFSSNVAIGGYLAMLVRQDIAPYNTARYIKTGGFGDYVKSGVIGEASLSFLNEKKRGMVIGLRATADILGGVMSKKNKSLITPEYITLGIFYNVLNRYW